MKAVLGVVHREMVGAWVYLENGAEGVTIQAARVTDSESIQSTIADGIRETGCRDVAGVLSAGDVHVGSFDPRLTRRKSRRQLYHMCYSTAAQLRFDRKKDDVRFLRGETSVAFGVGRAVAIDGMKAAAKQNGAKLVGLHAESHALAAVLPPEYEIGVYEDDSLYRVVFIATDATKIEICESAEDLAASIVAASAEGYIGGHLTPIAALDDATFGLRDSRGLFRGRVMERFEAPHGLSGLGMVALGAGYVMYEGLHERSA